MYRKGAKSLVGFNYHCSGQFLHLAFDYTLFGVKRFSILFNFINVHQPDGTNSCLENESNLDTKRWRQEQINKILTVCSFLEKLTILNHIDPWKNALRSVPFGSSAIHGYIFFSSGLSYRLLGNLDFRVYPRSDFCTGDKFCTPFKLPSRYQYISKNSCQNC